MKPPNYAPIYAALYPDLAEIARKHGYAMAVHGTMGRDLDLICVPWTLDASAPSDVVDEIVRTFKIEVATGPSLREHNRQVWGISIMFGECFLDLSFTPRQNVSDEASQ
jgi:hypothetical protein